jgi:hypothetical protein
MSALGGSIAKVPEPSATDFPLGDAPSDNRRSIYPQVASEVASEFERWLEQFVFGVACSATGR